MTEFAGLSGSGPERPAGHDAGRILGVESFANDTKGFRQMRSWMSRHGEIDRVGIEGTGSYGAGLARHFTRTGVEVLEVCRHDRQRRRMKGKSDTVDAEAAARTTLARDMVATPKTGTGSVEAIRALRIPRNSAMKARTQTANQIHTLVDTAPDQLREQLRGRSIRELVGEMARWRPGPPTDPFGQSGSSGRPASLSDSMPVSNCSSIMTSPSAADDSTDRPSASRPK